MCTISLVAQDFLNRNPLVWQEVTTTWPAQLALVPQAEFDKLKKEVEELKELMKAAKRFDAATGQPDCEDENKMVILRGVAKALGVDLDSVLKPQIP